MAQKAVLAGATGLIGSEMLKILLDTPEYDQVLVVARKSTGIYHSKLKELLIDFDKLDDYAEEITGHAIFCCLGTTKSKTPDLTIYRKIDHDYPVKLAQLGAQNGVEQYHLVSSIGADSKASGYYLRFKGETEEDVKQAGIKSTHIYEPSFIVGDRKEFRLAEKIIVGLSFVINPLLRGSLKKYRSIEATDIAKAMYNQSFKNSEGVFVHASDKIKELALERGRFDLATRDKYQITFHNEQVDGFGLRPRAHTDLIANGSFTLLLTFAHLVEIKAIIEDVNDTVNRYNDGLYYDDFWGSIEGGSQIFIILIKTQ